MPLTYSLIQHQNNLNRIKNIQPSLQPLAEKLVLNAAGAGIPVRVVQDYRTPEQQQALLDSGKGVTNAGANLSYHNYRLAFDIVPEAYLSFPDWNPKGEYWAKLGAIGKSLGLEWGGDWKKKDLPHFQVPSSFAPIRELKAYLEKFGKIMPVEITPALGGMAVLVIVGIVLFIYRDQL